MAIPDGVDRHTVGPCHVDRRVDPTGQRLGLQVLDIAAHGPREELRAAHPERLGVFLGSCERLVRYRNRGLHNRSITRYNFDMRSTATPLPSRPKPASRSTRHAGRLKVMELDFERCYRAADSRDERFDGWFYTAVTTTGIYCRPSCPAVTPKRSNVRFFPSAAAAQREGFRACRRCRPDVAPGSPEWDVRADVVGRAMRLIGDGVVDRDGVPGLACRLGYTERHLHRLLTAELGAGPLALARAQRAQIARILIETTELGFGEIAFAAGFGSVRQFNDTILKVYAQPPSVLRTRRSAPQSDAGTISL